MTRTAKVIENALDAVTQIILFENVQNHRRTRTKELSSEVLGVIAVDSGRRIQSIDITHLKQGNCFWGEMQTRQYPTWFQLGLCEECAVQFGELLTMEIEEVEDAETTCGDGECLNVRICTFDVLQRFGFFLQMGFTHILATLDGLDVGLLGDVISGDDCDDDE
ncbi:hypothetical protein Tco_1148755 [Tanacetum coccineum]